MRVMLSDLAATHNKMKISLIRTMSVCLLLCTAVITGQQRDQKRADGPLSVDLGDVVKRGNIKIDDADAKTLSALPRGYSAMPGMAYRITTDAVAAGPYTVVFGVASITNEETFNSLRILHAEPDQFDPDSAVWIDRTVIEPGASAPNFARQTITAYSDELETGIYIVAKQTEKIAPISAVADVEVIAQPSREVVQMPANITFSVLVKNTGPQDATDVGFKQQISRGSVVSMKPSQGSCKWKPGWVYCKLGQLGVGNSATLAVEVDPSPDFQGTYRSYVEVAAKEVDRNRDNNVSAVSVDTHADPNLPPEVTLESPVMEEVFEQGATVVFKATASDSDGSITKVEFLDNDESLGIGTTTDAKHFSFSTNQLANGRHVLTALATDNGGRQTGSGAQQIFVNGPIKLRIVKPKLELSAGSDLILTILATNPSGSIKKIEVFLNGGFELGEATAIGGGRYKIKIPSLEKTSYSIEAFATDTEGLVSKSVLLNLIVTK